MESVVTDSEKSLRVQTFTPEQRAELRQGNSSTEPKGSVKLRQYGKQRMSISGWPKLLTTNEAEEAEKVKNIEAAKRRRRT
jgi:hypothetical protein